MPNGSRRIRRQPRSKASSVSSPDTLLCLGFEPACTLANAQLSIAGLAAGGVKRRIGAPALALLGRNLLDDVVVCVRADDGRGEISRRLLAAADNQRDPPTASSVSLRRSAAMIALIGLPIVAVALYLPL